MGVYFSVEVPVDRFPSNALQFVQVPRRPAQDLRDLKNFERPVLLEPFGELYLFLANSHRLSYRIDGRRSNLPESLLPFSPLLPYTQQVFVTHQ